MDGHYRLGTANVILAGAGALWLQSSPGQAGRVSPREALSLPERPGESWSGRLSTRGFLHNPRSELP